jgi:hypothetical protein
MFWSTTVYLLLYVIRAFLLSSSSAKNELFLKLFKLGFVHCLTIDLLSFIVIGPFKLVHVYAIDSKVKSG